MFNWFKLNGYSISVALLVSFILIIKVYLDWGTLIIIGSIFIIVGLQRTR
ncbi:hypothetical protein C5H55_001508 [Pediococcus pentosaceus]|jgi:hypothetical protein|nr:hypothetical protein T256_04475 [Pediococcus pentosaceus SL4]MCI1488447.1 hypothetical protein [Pediococcus pentosaceus]QHM59451.1 hypothetical protein C7M46_00094 [Pediococcus pentosaceus]QHO66721.1 hypothetical protein C7M44_00085 [Pediococcus pentosaceus]TDG55327.1 hypothetical protein C5H55_001508 [Pediococcus pentosaceus]